MLLKKYSWKIVTKKLSSILPFYSERKIGGLRNCKAAKSDSVDSDST